MARDVHLQCKLGMQAKVQSIVTSPGRQLVWLLVLVGSDGQE